MVCPFCKSNNVEETEFSKYRSSRRWAKKNEYSLLYNCNDCGYHGPINNLLEARRIKIDKIKAKYESI